MSRSVPDCERRSGWCARIRGWPLWSVPGSAVIVLICAPVVAVVATGWLIATRPTGGWPTAAVFAGLLALSVGYAELSHRVERLKLYLSAGTDRPVPNPLSVWSFAALLLLPAGWAALFVVALYVQVVVHAGRDATRRIHQQIHTASAAVLAQLAAAAVLAGAGGQLDHPSLAGTAGVLAAGLTFTVSDFLLMALAKWLAAGRPAVRSLVPDADAVGYELSCLAMGVATAALLVLAPLLVVVALGPIAYLHRASTTKLLHEAARTDPKTGLLNSTMWRAHAQARLARCIRHGTPIGVLLSDVDHFKRVNDRFGHLVGDEVIKSVAEAMTSAVRTADAVGRFGGDEFVVLFDRIDLPTASRVAARIRESAADLGPGDPGRPAITLSLGLAHVAAPGPGLELDDLLAAADDSLYHAKSTGRNRLSAATLVADDDGAWVVGTGAPQPVAEVG